MSAQSRPQTILFADVSGSTRLFEIKGDVEARRLIARVLDALSAICRENGGRVIKTIGDEIMCTFPGALNGVLAACDMQRRMGRDPEFVRDSLAVRIGLHHGDALEEADGDVYGDAVNTAARMASLAKREQIVTTAATYDSLTGKVPEARGLGKARVSGKLLPIAIVDLVWQEDTSGMTMVQSAIRIVPAAAAAPPATAPPKPNTPAASAAYTPTSTHHSALASRSTEHHLASFNTMPFFNGPNTATRRSPIRRATPVPRRSASTGGAPKAISTTRPTP